jgi:hypothetical protein
MLEALLGAALRTVLLAVLVELCLRALRVRHPQLLLAAWTAVLAASLAMPMMQRCALITVPVAIDLPVSFADLPGGENTVMAAADAAPPAVKVEPVISPASSEARNTTQRAISSGSPRRPIGINGRMLFSSTSFGTACTISVLM